MIAIALAAVLAAILATPPADPDTLGAIEDQFLASVERLYEPRAEGEEKAASAEFQATRAALVDRAVALAKADPGSPAAVDALSWVVRRGRPNSEPRLRAIEALRRDHVASDRLVEGCRAAANSVGKELVEGERLLRDAIDKNPHAEVKGWATFSLAELLETRADLVREAEADPSTPRLDDSTRRALMSRTPDDLLGESEALYRQVSAKYPDLEHPRTGKPAGEVAEGRAFRLRHLSVGRVAPEIEGVDVDGRPLKLSDHRGEVVLLTFTGIWCPSCHQVYPQQRDLLAKHRGKGFATLSVFTDDDKGTLRKAIADGKVTWPCWWDGGVGGPITVRCGIYYFPSLFVIDRKGIVRARDPSPAELDEVVERLLKED